MSSYIFHTDISKFVTDTSRYNGENALVLADCTQLAYESEQTIQQALQVDWRFNYFQFFNGEGTQAFVAGNHAIIIVVFRGVEGRITDIVAEIKMQTTLGAAGMVHRGFNEALHTVWGNKAPNDIRTAIKTFQDNNQRIWFCGHGLGGALATLAATEYVVNDQGTINGLYTFGQPRVGNTVFSAVANKILARRYFRFVNNNDIVADIPFSGLLFNYTHAGNLLYINSAGKLKNDIPLWKKVLFKLKGRLHNIEEIKLADLHQHQPESYIRLIHKNRTVIIV